MDLFTLIVRQTRTWGESYGGTLKVKSIWSVMIVASQLEIIIGNASTDATFALNIKLIVALAFVPPADVI